MARQNRFRISNVPQHVVQRGHNGEPIFHTSRDYVVFLECLAEAIAVSQARVHTYALLPNRIEFLCTPKREDGVSRLMQAVGTRYRKEVTDVGLGFAPRGMVPRLFTCGLRPLGRLARSYTYTTRCWVFQFQQNR